MTTRFADHLLTGIHADRPAANAVPAGTLYACSTHGLIYQSDGSSWATWATITSSGLTDPTTTRGDMLFRNSGGAIARLALGAANTLLHGSSTDPSYSAVLPADLDVSADNTTADATTGHHGLLPKLGGGTTNFLRADGTYAAPPAGAVPATSVALTSGNITIGNGQSAHAAITATALDLTIAAATNDILQISFSRLHQNSGTGETFFDVASVVSSTLTNYASGGSGTGGIMGLYRTNNTPNFLGQDATILYTVQAGDISGGNVLLRPVAYNTGNANGTVYCQAAYPIHFSVANLKH